MAKPGELDWSELADNAYDAVAHPEKYDNKDRSYKGIAFEEPFDGKRDKKRMTLHDARAFKEHAKGKTPRNTYEKPGKPNAMGIKDVSVKDMPGVTRIDYSSEGNFGPAGSLFKTKYPGDLDWSELTRRNNG